MAQGRPPLPSTRKIKLINQLKHVKGPFAGQTFNLRPWQKAIIRRLFELDPYGRRKHRLALLMLPRKNGKSALGAALAIDGLLFDHEAGAEVISAAADREQASLIFNMAVAMIRADAELEAMCEIVESQKRIVHRPSGSVYRAISAEAYSKHGANVSRCIYDELHAAPSRDLFDVLMTSMGGRAQPLMIAISTAGYDRHSVLFELYSHAKKVLDDPALDPSFLPIVYEAAPDDDWTDEQIWTKANPALGDFRSLEEMRMAAARAKEIPAQEQAFRRLYLNQWTESGERWISLEAWDRCRVGVERAALAGRRCFVGLDLSTTTDLSAAVAVFPDGDGFDVLAQFFLPEEAIRRRVVRDRVPYDVWTREGHITAIPGAVVDYERVRALLKEWDAAFDLRVIAYDPWNATDLVNRLEKEDGLNCFKVRQGFASLTAPSKSLETAVLSRKLRHTGDPVLRWNVGNVVAETDQAGNVRPSKKLSTERIDGAVALIMAIDAMERNDHDRPPAFQMFIYGRP
jgi:phage terminase large subunit-like protein